MVERNCVICRCGISLSKDRRVVTCHSKACKTERRRTLDHLRHSRQKLKICIVCKECFNSDQRPRKSNTCSDGCWNIRYKQRKSQNYKKYYETHKEIISTKNRIRSQRRIRTPKPKKRRFCNVCQIEITDIKYFRTCSNVCSNVNSEKRLQGQKQQKREERLKRKEEKIIKTITDSVALSLYKENIKEQTLDLRSNNEKLRSLRESRKREKRRKSRSEIDTAYALKELERRRRHQQRKKGRKELEIIKAKTVTELLGINLMEYVRNEYPTRN